MDAVGVALWRLDAAASQVQFQMPCKEYCEKSFDIADDKKKSLERSVSNLEKAIEKAKEAIAALADEIKALEAGIVALDKAVAEATEQRKEEITNSVQHAVGNGHLHIGNTHHTYPHSAICACHPPLHRGLPE